MLSPPTSRGINRCCEIRSQWELMINLRPASCTQTLTRGSVLVACTCMYAYCIESLSSRHKARITDLGPKLKLKSKCCSDGRTLMRPTQLISASALLILLSLSIKGRPLMACFGPITLLATDCTPRLPACKGSGTMIKGLIFIFNETFFRNKPPPLFRSRRLR